MPLSRALEKHASAIREFVASTHANLMYLRAAPEAEMLAAKLVAAAEAHPHSDALFFAHSSAFDEPAAFYTSAVDSVLANLSQHEAALRSQAITLPHIEGLDSAYCADEPLQIELAFAEFADRLARGLARHCDSVVFVLRTEDGVNATEFLASTQRVAAAVSLRHVKLIVLTQPEVTLPEPVPAGDRLRVVEFDPDDAATLAQLRDFLARPTRRVLAAKLLPTRTDWSRAPLMAAKAGLAPVELLRLECASNKRGALPSSALAALQREAQRRGDDLVPDEALSPVARLADFAEQFARARFPSKGVLLISLEPVGDAGQLRAAVPTFVHELAAAACSPRVRYLVPDPVGLKAQPPMIEAPRQALEQTIAVDAAAIDRGLQEKLADPALPLVERIQGTGMRASMAATNGDHAGALSLHNEVLELCDQAGDPVQTLFAWLGVGNSLYRMKRWPDAESAYTNALGIALDVDQVAGAAQALTRLGHTLLCAERAAEAVESYRAAADWCDKQGDVLSACHVGHWLGEAQRRLGEKESACETWNGVKTRYASLGKDLRPAAESGTAELLERLARVHDELGDGDAAGRERTELSALGQESVHVPEQP